MGPLVAMQKVLLAVPRSFPKGFHYTEKNRLHILGETHVSIRKLLETGVWLVHVGQFLSLLDKKYVAGHQWDHYHPYEHQTKRALFFFFFFHLKLSQGTQHPVCTQCWPWPTTPLLQAVALGSNMCHRQAQQSQLTPRRSRHVARVGLLWWIHDACRCSKEGRWGAHVGNSWPA